MQIQIAKYASMRIQMQSLPKVCERQQCAAAIQMELDGTHVQTPSTRTTTHSWSNIQKS